jgi:hypothetical protein
VFKRLRQVLVESFVGAIALGWILAQGISHLTASFTSPLAAWVMQKEMQSFQSSAQSSPAGWESAALQRAVLELVRAVALLVFCYVLLRWLYYTPLQETSAEVTPNPEETP